MSTQDHNEILAHYRTLKLNNIAVEALALEHGAWLLATKREPIAAVTRRIRAMVREYLEGYPRRMSGRW